MTLHVFRLADAQHPHTPWTPLAAAEADAMKTGTDKNAERPASGRPAEVADWAGRPGGV
jgi:hypothetical protein